MPGERQLSPSWRKPLDMDLEAMGLPPPFLNKPDGGGFWVKLCALLLCRIHSPLVSGQAVNHAGSFFCGWLE